MLEGQGFLPSPDLVPTEEAVKRRFRKSLASSMADLMAVATRARFD